jgi:hypothetical protein
MDVGWARQDTRAHGGIVFSVESLPFTVDDEDGIVALAAYVDGAAVFSSDRHALDYLHRLAKRDLQYRGFRDDRFSSFCWKSEANSNRALCR